MATDELESAINQDSIPKLEQAIAWARQHGVDTAKARTRLAELIRGLNAVTKSGLGAGGVFHAAIEVENLSRGLEWSYGYSADGSGVFAIKAKQHPDHTYRETVVLGRTALNREQLLKRLCDCVRDELQRANETVSQLDATASPIEAALRQERRQDARQEPLPGFENRAWAKEYIRSLREADTRLAHLLAAVNRTAPVRAVR